MNDYAPESSLGWLELVEFLGDRLANLSEDELRRLRIDLSPSE